MRSGDALARGSIRNTLALAAGFSSSDADARPRPIAAGSIGAEDVDLSSIILNRTSNTIDGKTGDGDTVGGLASRRTVLVVLLNDDTVLGDAGEGDVRVSDVGDGAGGIVDGLDAHAVLGVLDGGARDGDVLDIVVATAANRANGETMATAAGSAGERDGLAIIHC